MRQRRKPLSARAFDALPVLLVVGLGIGGVFVAMNILVTVPPPLIDSASPSASASPSPLPSPTLPPIVEPTIVVTAAPTASLPPFGPTIIHSAVSASDPGGAWTVYIYYPSFEEGSTPWAPQINADLRAEFETTASQWEAGPAAYRAAGAKMNSLTSTFTTDLISPALAAFTMSWSDDSTPGEPVKLTVETLNFDLGTGQRIPFNSLFLDPDSALALISSESATLLQEQLGAAYEPGLAVDGTSPSTTNFRNWTLTPNGLKITFAEHQVSSQDTTPSIVLPWSVLAPVMAPAGPIAALAGS
jgi:hypothetical protein